MPSFSSIKSHARAAILALSLFAQPALAQVYNGGGLSEGVTAAATIAVPHSDLRTVILHILATALSYLALIAVTVIIIAGFILILSLGSETARDRAKRIIIYTLIGLAVILFSELIISFVLTVLTGGSVGGTSTI